MISQYHHFKKYHHLKKNLSIQLESLKNFLIFKVIWVYQFFQLCETWYETLGCYGSGLLILLK